MPLVVLWPNDNDVNFPSKDTGKDSKCTHDYSKCNGCILDLWSGQCGEIARDKSKPDHEECKGAKRDELGFIEVCWELEAHDSEHTSCDDDQCFIGNRKNKHWNGVTNTGYHNLREVVRIGRVKS